MADDIIKLGLKIDGDASGAKEAFNEIMGSLRAIPVQAKQTSDQTTQAIDSIIAKSNDLSYAFSALAHNPSGFMGEFAKSLKDDFQSEVVPAFRDLQAAAGEGARLVWDEFTAQTYNKIADLGEKVGDKLKETIEHPLETLKASLVNGLESLGPFGVGIVAIGGAAAVAGKEMFDLAEGAAKVGSELGDFAIITSTSVQETAHLKAVADLAGSSLGAMQGLAFQLSRQMELSGEGAERFDAGLRDLSINADEFRKMSLNEQILAISEGLNRGALSGNNMADAVAILGYRGRQFLPLLSKDLADIAEQAKDVELAFTEKDAKAAEAFEIQLRKLHEEWDNFKISVGNGLVVPITYVLRVINDTGAGLKGALSQPMGDDDIKRQAFLDDLKRQELLDSGRLIEQPGGSALGGKEIEFARPKPSINPTEDLSVFVGDTDKLTKAIGSDIAKLQKEFADSLKSVAEVGNVYSTLTGQFYESEEALKKGEKAFKDAEAAAKKWPEGEARVLNETRLLWQNYAVDVAKATGGTYAAQIQEANNWYDNQIKTIEDEAKTHIDAWGKKDAVDAIYYQKQSDALTAETKRKDEEAKKQEEIAKRLTDKQTAANERSAKETLKLWSDFNVTMDKNQHQTLEAQLDGVHAWYEAQYAAMKQSGADDEEMYAREEALNADYYAKLEKARQDDFDKQQHYRRQTEDLWSQVFALRDRLVGNELESQLSANQRWFDDEVAKIKKDEYGWQDHYNALVALAQEKALAIAAAFDPVLRSALQLQKDLNTGWKQTFDKTLLQTHSFESAFVSVFDMLKSDVENIFYSLLGNIVKGFLQPLMQLAEGVATSITSYILNAVSGAGTGGVGAGGGWGSLILNGVTGGRIGGGGGVIGMVPGMNGGIPGMAMRGAGLLMGTGGAAGTMFGAGQGALLSGIGSTPLIAADAGLIPGEAGYGVLTAGGSQAAGGAGAGAGGFLSAAAPYMGAALAAYGIYGGVKSLMAGQGYGTIHGMETGAGIGTMIAPGIGTLIGAGVGALAGYISGIGKPDQQELEGRGAQKYYTEQIYKSATDKEKAEATAALSPSVGGWHEVEQAGTLIVLRDQYMELGMTAEEAGKKASEAADSLGKAEVDGADAVTKAMEQINKDLGAQYEKEAKAVSQGIQDLNKYAVDGAGSIDTMNTSMLAAVGFFQKAILTGASVTDVLRAMAPALNAITQQAANFGPHADVYKPLVQSLRDAQAELAKTQQGTAAFDAATAKVTAAQAALDAALKTTSLTGNAAMDALLKMNIVVQKNPELMQAIADTTAMIKDMDAAGVQTQESLQQFGQEAYNQFVNLTAATGDQNEALIMMQPSLQALWEQQKKYGNITDENVIKMLDMAEKQGIVGESQRSTNDKILDVLVLIGKALGADIPEALDTFKEAGENAADGVKNHLDMIPRRLDIQVNTNHTSTGDDGGGGGSEGPGYAAGGLVLPQYFRHGGVVQEPQYLGTGGITRTAFRSKGTDTVATMLSVGESVLTRQATARLGISTINRINAGGMGTMMPSLGKPGSVGDSHDIHVHIDGVMVQISAIDAQDVKRFAESDKFQGAIIQSAARDKNGFGTKLVRALNLG